MRDSLGMARSCTARAAAKRTLTQEVSYSDTQVVRSRLILTKRRYKAYRGFWDGLGSESASSDFDELLKLQGHAYSGPDGDQVAVSGNEAERIVQGEKIMHTTSEEPSAAPSAPRLGSDAPAPRPGGDRSDRPRRRDDKRSRVEGADGSGGGAAQSSFDRRGSSARIANDGQRGRRRSRSRRRHQRHTHLQSPTQQPRPADRHWRAALVDGARAPSADNNEDTRGRGGRGSPFAQVQLENQLMLEATNLNAPSS